MHTNSETRRREKMISLTFAAILAKLSRVSAWRGRKGVKTREKNEGEKKRG